MTNKTWDPPTLATTREPPEGLLRYADVCVDLTKREVRRGDLQIEPTRREFDLLVYFLRNPRQVLTRRQILDAVWGYDLGTVSNAVDVYVGYLRRKLEANGRPRLIQTIHALGYAFRDD